jgi:Abnormal spindle-like microcephaly-assoc'd, ASPM-SPD-2-Hydin
MGYKFRWIIMIVVGVFLGAVIVGCGSTGASSAQTSTGTPPPTGTAGLNLSPANLSFGSVAVGGRSSQTVTLTNGGSSSISVSAANVGGSGFSVSGMTFPKSIAAGASATASITFAPQATGNASGSVSFVSNAANSPAVLSASGSGFTATAHSVDLSWGASSSTVAGYRVYRSTQTGSGYQLITGALVSGTIYTDSTVQSGVTYYYVVTAVDSQSAESFFSNEATAAIPIP